MITFFENLWGLISNVFEFFAQTIKSILMLIGIVREVVFFPVEITNFVPAFLLTSIYVVIIIGALKLLLGRGNT